MSRRVASYSAPCPSCGAVAGEPCLVAGWTKKRRAHYTHAPRKRAIAAAVREHSGESTGSGTGPDPRPDAAPAAAHRGAAGASTTTT